MGGLHLAAAKGFGDIAQLLLDSGIAPDMQDKVNYIFEPICDVCLQWNNKTSNLVQKCSNKHCF